MNQPDARTEIFRSSWSLYDTVIEENYMYHRQIHAGVRDVLGARAVRGGYALLDLGCGNARGLADSLRAFPPRRYLGVDLSRAALDGAARELEALPAVELREADMLRCAQGVPAGSFDLVYSGFAMHHLAAEEKERLFRAIAAALTPGGAFLLVDILREDGESREVYLENYLGMVRAEWRALTADQIEEVRQHITAHDFPETFPALVELARGAGLEQAHLLARHGQHQVILFS